MSHIAKYLAILLIYRIVYIPFHYFAMNCYTTLTPLRHIPSILVATEMLA